MPYVERITKGGKPTGERYFTPESQRERLQRENTEKAAARLRQLLQEDYDGSDIKVDIVYEKTGRSLLMEMKSCGRCAAACGIEGKNEVVGCKDDGKLHNAQEQNACYHVEDCDTCVHKYMYRGDVEACQRRDAGLDCEYQERELRTCPTCDKEVYRDEMQYTRDCHGITFRLVCWDCYNRLMAKGYDGEYYDEADEQIDDY